jgi:hypothetical protein
MKQDELSLNSTTMKKGFKNIFDEPIYAHHRNMCLNLAATLLLETDNQFLKSQRVSGIQIAEILATP